MEVTSNILPGYIIGKPSPSAADGVSDEEESLHRTFGCELVLQGGTVLGLPQVVIITGQNILNRFYYRKSLKRFDVFSIAMGSLLLASKVEECFKTLREILFAFHFIYARRKGLHLKPMELGGQQYTQWKNELIMMERYILKELGFSLYNIMDHPHKYILYFVKVLNGSEALANTAWSYLNDSMRLDISLRFEAQAIACAAIFLAGRKLSVALPESGEAGPWWQVFGATTRDVQSISDAILTIYETPKVGWLEPLAKVEYLSPETCAMFDQVVPQERATEERTANVPSLAIATQVPFPLADGRNDSGAAALESGRDSAPGGATPEAGASRSSTPPVRREADARAEGGERKLERKWMSVVGDIDKMESAAPPAATAEQPVYTRGERGTRSVSRGRRSVSQGRVEKEDARDRSRYADDRERSDRPKSGRDERDDGRRKRDRSDSRDRRDDRGSRRADSRDRGRRRDDSRSRGGGRERSRDRDRERDRERDRGSDRDRRRDDSRDRADRGRGRY